VRFKTTLKTTLKLRYFFCYFIKMSFLKIKDPKIRDLIVAEFLKTKKNIQDSFITERVGDIGAQMELSKFFKLITDTRKDIKKA